MDGQLGWPAWSTAGGKPGDDTVVAVDAEIMKTLADIYQRIPWDPI